MADSYTCPVCDKTSHHPKDVEQGYCGNCHRYTGDPYRPLTAEELKILDEAGFGEE